MRVGSGVVLIGGTTSSRAMASTDVWNHNGWAAGPTLSQGRIKLAAITLRDDRVLVVGGAADTEGRRKLATTEVLDISAGTAVPGPPLHEGEYKLDGAAVCLNYEVVRNRISVSRRGTHRTRTEPHQKCGGRDGCGR